MSGREAELIKAAYEDGKTYRRDTICLEAERNAPEYAVRLLWDKHETIRRHLQPGTLVDLCCATGVHLIGFAPLVREAIGVDFTASYIEKAVEDARNARLSNARFEVGDATNLTLDDGTVDTLYSLSALYIIPNLEAVIGEVSRVLRVGGRCILDLGNSRSLNSYCVSHYTELPPSYHIPVSEMRAMLRRHDLKIVEHRAFQILPLWAGKPSWLWPLLHPGWKTIMRRRVRGRMVDEWVSNLPGLRHFAFRHVIVAEKAHW